MNKQIESLQEENKRLREKIDDLYEDIELIRHTFYELYSRGGEAFTERGTIFDKDLWTVRMRHHREFLDKVNKELENE